MPSGISNRFKTNLLNKLIDLGSGGDAIRVALLDNVHVFDPDDDVLADVVANEISGTGYTANGELLTTQTVTQDDVNDKAVFDADDVSWTTATFTARFALLYDDTLVGNDIIGSIDFGSDKSVTAGTFTIQWSANGIVTLA